MTDSKKLETLILDVVDQRGYLSGYEFYKKLYQQTKQRVFKIYATLHNLKEKGFLKGFWRFEDGRHRKYYRQNFEQKAEYSPSCPNNFNLSKGPKT